MTKHWICRKCNYIQGKNWSIYHRCSNCGSLDLEMKTEEELQKLQTPLVVTN